MVITLPSRTQVGSKFMESLHTFSRIFNRRHAIFVICWLCLHWGQCLSLHTPKWLANNLMCAFSAVSTFTLFSVHLHTRCVVLGKLLNPKGIKLIRHSRRRSGRIHSPMPYIYIYIYILYTYIYMFFSPNAPVYGVLANKKTMLWYVWNFSVNDYK